MKIGQLKEYSMRNNFFEKLYPKCSGEVRIPDKIFGTKWSNPVKLEKKRKVWYLICVCFNCYLQSLSS